MFRSVNEAGRDLRGTSQDNLQRMPAGVQDRQVSKVVSSIFCGIGRVLGIPLLDCSHMGRNGGFSFGKVLCLQLLYSKHICQAEFFFLQSLSSRENSTFLPSLGVPQRHVVEHMMLDGMDLPQHRFFLQIIHSV